MKEKADEMDQPQQVSPKVVENITDIVEAHERRKSALQQLALKHSQIEDPFLDPRKLGHSDGVTDDDDDVVY